MKNVLYIAAFAFLFTAFSCATSSGGDDFPRCEFGSWPGKMPTKGTITSYIPSFSKEHNMRFVNPSLPLFCAKVYNPLLTAYKHIHTINLHSVKFTNEEGKYKLPLKAYINPNDYKYFRSNYILVWFDKTKPRRAQWIQVAEITNATLDIQEVFQNAKALTLWLLKKPNSGDLHLQQRGEYLYNPSHSWYSYPNRIDVDPCFRLPTNKKLHPEYVYQLQLRESQLLLRSAVGKPALMRHFKTPTKRVEVALEQKAFHHEGGCYSHSAYTFQPTQRNPAMLYRWAIYDEQMTRQLSPFGDRAIGPLGKSSKDGFSMLGYAPAFSSLWISERTTGKRLKLRVQAIHASGAISAPKIYDVPVKPTRSPKELDREAWFERIVKTKVTDGLIGMYWFFELCMLAFVGVMLVRKKDLENKIALSD